MPNKLNTQLGQWVEVSCNPDGSISSTSWVGGGVTLRGQVVGFDSSGSPLIHIPGAAKQTGCWDVASDRQKLLLGMDKQFVDSVPLNKPCLFQLFEETSFQAVPLNSEKSKMKHNLKPGDRIVVSVNSGSSQPAIHSWSAVGSAALTATVVGQKANGNPILQFDTNPGYSFMQSWEYNYGTDLSLIDPALRPKFRTYDKTTWVMENDYTAFVSEADYKLGKRPEPTGMPLDSLDKNFAVLVGAGNNCADTKEFMKHVANVLADEPECFLYGEQFAALLTKQLPVKHDVFCKDKRTASSVVQGLRNTFSDAQVVHCGVVESSNPDLNVEEYMVKWRHHDTMYRQFKVQIATPANPSVKSPFEKGGVDALSFQMHRKDHMVRNAATKNFNSVVTSTMAKQFAAYGEANKALIEEIIKKGFSSKGKIKETKKTMSNANGTAPSFAQMMKDDFHKATYRVAADQITHGIKEGIVAMLKSKGGTQPQLEGMMLLLDSEVGEAGIAMLAGLGLTYAPMVSEDPRAQKLAGEFRVNGMAKMGNVLVENLLGTFLPIVQGALAKLPAEEQVRVAETPSNARIGTGSNAEQEAAEEEANTASPEPKKAVA